VDAKTTSSRQRYSFVVESHRAEMSFALTIRQRFLWAIGSPFRGCAWAAIIAFLCWLGFVSIGISAVVVLLSAFLVGHLVPFTLAGRSRLSVTEAGIFDHSRFRKKFYPWASIATFRASSLTRFVHGLVIELKGPKEGEKEDAIFLRSSWRPTRREVIDIVHVLADAGWPIDRPRSRRRQARPASDR
jgi:hypothetical protein